MPTLRNFLSGLGRFSVSEVEHPAADSGSSASSSARALAKAQRRRQTGVDGDRALSLSTIYRGIQIHATSVCQLTLDAERSGVPVAATPLLLEQPDLAETLEAFLEYTVTSLYIDGNAFWRIIRADASSPRAGQVIELKPLNPAEVAVVVTRDARGVDRLSYNWRGQSIPAADVRHLKFLRIPGLHRGLGPIQAAQLEVRGALDARDYGALWLSDSNMPDGVLTTDQELGPGDTEKYRHVWYGRNADGTDKDDDGRSLSERLRVLGKGLSYTPLLLKPSDVQFLETQQFNDVRLARLIGAPASLMLVATEGTSQTYSNVEQEWIGYVRFSLMKPLREIESHFTALLPGKSKARFNIEGLLRSDTKTRYEGHALALDRWMLPEEVRRVEGLPPLSADDLARLIAATPTPVPAKESDK